MRKHLAALALVSALALPSAAQATVTISFGSTSDIPAINDFETELHDNYGADVFATTGSSITVDSDSNILFYFLGSESGYSDTLTTPHFAYNENSGFSNSFAAPTFVGGGFFAAGSSLAGLLNFTGGGPATVGDGGFSIFLSPNATSGTSVSSFVFGYDDQLTSPDDDNHDDMIFYATVAPVPEPATWAMMLLGFGAVGAAMRRKRSATRTALAGA